MSTSETRTRVEANSAVPEGRIVRTPGLLPDPCAIFPNLPRNRAVIGALSEIHENHFGTAVAASIDAGGGHDWVLGGGGSVTDLRAALTPGHPGSDTLTGVERLADAPNVARITVVVATLHGGTAQDSILV